MILPCGMDGGHLTVFSWWRAALAPPGRLHCHSGALVGMVGRLDSAGTVNQIAHRGLSVMAALQWSDFQ